MSYIRAKNFKKLRFCKNDDSSFSSRIKKNSSNFIKFIGRVSYWIFQKNIIIQQEIFRIQAWNKEDTSSKIRLIFMKKRYKYSIKLYTFFVDILCIVFCDCFVCRKFDVMWNAGKYFFYLRKLIVFSKVKPENNELGKEKYLFSFSKKFLIYFLDFLIFYCVLLHSMAHFVWF